MKNLLLFIILFTSFLVPAQERMKDYNNVIKSQSIYEIDAFLRDAHPDDPRRSILKPRLMDLIKDYLKKATPEDQQVKVLQEKLALLKRRPSTKITFEEMNEAIRQKIIRLRNQQLADIQAGVYKKSAEEKKMKPLASRSSSTSSRNTSSSSKTSILSKTKSSTTKTSTSKPVEKAEVSTSLASNFENPEQGEFNMLMDESPEDHKNKTVKILNALFDNDPNSKDTTVLVKNNSDCDIIVRMEGIGYTKYRLPVPSGKENTIVIAKGDYLFTSLVCGAQYASQKTVQKAIMVTLGKPGK